MKKAFFITTPIYYVNDVPHLGHTCTTLAADIIARYHRQKEESVFFLTGTDEHGAKVAQAAKQAGLSPQSFCDQVSRRFQKAWDKLNISHDFFFRTTDPRHREIVYEVLQKINQNGDIYKGKYEGYYCQGCEKFVTQDDLIDGKCPLHPSKKISYQSEENYFFRLSKYIPQIIALIENDDTNYIYPDGKRREVLAKLRGGVSDVSISREKVKWGIPFPFDQSHTIYVWVEALINYYSATRFLKGKSKFWPADIHLIAKDILWFHTVIWQALLLSAGLPLPRRVYVHGYYSVNGQKMSKSLGNVIAPDNLIEKYGVEGSRYLVASSFPLEEDTDVSWQRFTEKYNADLANNLGNLVSRVTRLAEKYSLIAPLITNKFYPQVEKALINASPHRALEYLWQKKVDPCNSFLNQEKPWQQPENKAKEILGEIAGQIGQIAYNLKPFLPQTSTEIERLFCPGKRIVAPVKPLFPRLG